MWSRYASSSLGCLPGAQKALICGCRPVCSWRPDRARSYWSSRRSTASLMTGTGPSPRLSAPTWVDVSGVFFLKLLVGFGGQWIQGKASTDSIYGFYLEPGSVLVLYTGCAIPRDQTLNIWEIQWVKKKHRSRLKQKKPQQFIIQRIDCFIKTVILDSQLFDSVLFSNKDIKEETGGNIWRWRW